MNLENFNNVKIVLDVPYDKKAIAKEYKARWCPIEKIWYIMHNKDEPGEYNRQRFGYINIISLFKIKEIRHVYYEPNSEKHNELINYYKNLRKKIRNELHKCTKCECEYKFKHEDKHLLSQEHLNYIKEHENDVYDY